MKKEFIKTYNIIENIENREIKEKYRKQIINFSENKKWAQKKTQKSKQRKLKKIKIDNKCHN